MYLIVLVHATVVICNDHVHVRCIAPRERLRFASLCTFKPRHKTINIERMSVLKISGTPPILSPAGKNTRGVGVVFWVAMVG